MPRLNTNAEVLHDLRTVGYVSGSDVVIGETDTDGIQFSSETEETAVKVGTSRAAWLYIPGANEQTFSFNLISMSLENISEAFGLDPATRITGSGTSGSPYILTLNSANFSEQASRTWFAQGLREDGYTYRFEMPTAQVFCPQVTLKVVTGEPSSVPFKVRVLGQPLVKLWI